MNTNCINGNIGLSSQSWSNFCNDQEGMCSTATIELSSKEKLYIYPNPVNDFVYFNNELGNKILKSKIINAQTNEVILLSKNEYPIKVDHLSKGLYFLIVTFDDNSIKSFKLIK